MTGVLFFVAGAMSTLIVYAFLRSLLQSDRVLKQNYAGKQISTLGGLVVLVALLGLSAVLNLIPAVADENQAPFALLIVASGFAFLGLLDDLIGDKSSQGFKGHIAALLHGSVTTGSLKLFGGPVIAFLALAYQIPSRGYASVLLDVVVICLIANFFNLLDLAPGRCSKCVLLSLAVCAIVAPTPYYQYGVIGIVAVALIFDIREKFMLGDTGSNLLGALVGLAVVDCASDQATLIIALIAFVLNLLSEFVSYSSVIRGFLPLRVCDELGQTPERKAWARAK